MLTQFDQILQKYLITTLLEDILIIRLIDAVPSVPTLPDVRRGPPYG